MKPDIARLAELCRGKSIADATDLIADFLRVFRSQDARRIKLLREALAECVRKNETGAPP